MAMRRLVRALRARPGAKRVRRLMDAVVAARVKWIMETGRRAPRKRPDVISNYMTRGRHHSLNSGNDMVDACAYALDAVSRMNVVADRRVPRGHVMLACDFGVDAAPSPVAIDKLP